MKTIRKNYEALFLILTITFGAFAAIVPIQPAYGQGNQMTFTTGETISFGSTVEMSFRSPVSMKFGTGIMMQFIEAIPDGVVNPCDYFIIMWPNGFIPPPCSWWEVLDPNGNPTGFEFHVDFSNPTEFHVDMVYPGPFPILPPGTPFWAEMKIDSIDICKYFVVHEPASWYPTPCSWWEIIDPETGMETGYEFHVDWTNESCEFHIDQVIPSPLVFPFPYYYEVEARQKITSIQACDWYIVADPAGYAPTQCSWWEIMSNSLPTGLEFHVDTYDSGTNSFHVDQVIPDPLHLPLPPPYLAVARKKVDLLAPCETYKVSDLAATPKACTWWRILTPNLGDVEFHVDASDAVLGTFHIDEVHPSFSVSINPPVPELTAEQKFEGINPCDWFMVINPAQWLPSPCSWWTIISPSEWTGVRFHVDSTDGISKFHIDFVDALPAGPSPPPWNVTAESIDPWYWKPEYVDYVPSGMPDFDQRQSGTYPWWDQFGAWSHCGPVAVANSLWWLDSEFESTLTPPPAINDHFPLVQAYGQWDDHSSSNVQPLVEHLAFLMDTDGRRTISLIHSGTDVHDMEAGLSQYLSWTGINPRGDANGDGEVNQTDVDLVTAAMGTMPGMAGWNLAADIYPASTTYPPVADNIINMQDLALVTMNFGAKGRFYEHTLMTPTFQFIETEVEKCQDVVLLVGYWVFDVQSGTWYREPGGHFVTVAGVDSLDQKLALSDPVQDAFESGAIPEGRIPIPHIHMPPEPPYITHNDAAYVSQDIYSVTTITPPWMPPCPGGNLMLVNFASWRPAPPQFAVIEAAVVTSPLGIHDVAITDLHHMKRGCVPAETVCKPLRMEIYAAVKNEGDFQETFNVTLYANATQIGEQTVTLVAKANTSLTFTWDTTAFNEYSRYDFSAVAELSTDNHLADNTYNDGWVRVVHMGDVTGDGKVDTADIARVSGAFGSLRVNDPLNPKYGQYWHPIPCVTCPHQPNTDLNGDRKVDIQDLSRTSGNFGWHRP